MNTIIPSNQLSIEQWLKKFNGVGKVAKNRFDISNVTHTSGISIKNENGEYEQVFSETFTTPSSDDDGGRGFKPKYLHSFLHNFLLLS